MTRKMDNFSGLVWSGLVWSGLDNCVPLRPFCQYSYDV